MHCTVLTILYCPLLYYTALYFIVLYCNVLYCTVLYCTVLYCNMILLPAVNWLAVDKYITYHNNENRRTHCDNCDLISIFKHWCWKKCTFFLFNSLLTMLIGGFLFVFIAASNDGQTLFRGKVEEYRLPTAFASFSFSSSPVFHRVQ